MARRTHRQPTARAALVAAVLAGTAAGWTASPALAQPLAAAAADGITGRTFRGLSVGAGVQEGVINFRAAQALAWVDAETPLPGTEGIGTTRRLFLTGDVLVELGMYRFSAAQAVVWIEQLGVAEEDPSIPVYQVAVYFDRVGDPGAEAGIAQAGDRLLVTGILAGEVSLRTDILREARPETPLLAEGEARLARVLREVAGAALVEDEALRPRVGVDPTSPIRPGVSRPFEPETGIEGEPGVPAEARIGRPIEGEPIFAADGILTLAAGDWTIVGTDEEGEEAAVVVTGGAVFQYVHPAAGRSLEITAERAVLFLPPGRAAEAVTRFRPDEVRGLYLEGNVVARGQEPRRGEYTLRGPRMYYDMRANRAVVVDAVFTTFDERINLPIYVRARALRQEAQDQFSAQNVRLSTSTFFDPHFSIGASTVTLTRRAREAPVVAADGSLAPAGAEANVVSARNVTLRAGGVPFFYWPWFRGEIEHIPLRAVGFENSRNSGFAIKTTWDAFALAGVERPDWLDARVFVDGYFERGAALGTSLDWQNIDSRGGLFAYTLINDQGEDIVSPGTRVDREDQTRALVLGEHQWRIDQYWTLQLEGSYISDETFVDAFFRDLAMNRREFTNAAYLKRAEGNSVLSLLAEGSLQDFTPNHYLLQSQGYTVDKAPELGYFRVADDLLGFWRPGLVNWTHEYRLTRMRANFVEPTAAEFGFTTDQLALFALGVLPGESPADQLRAAGFTEDEVHRFDTRQELTIKADFGPLKVSPFVVGRFTIYDTGFEDFNQVDDDKHRLWGAAGVRASTSLQRVDNSVSSRLFDLHRIRHIIEPSVTFWTAGANLDQEQLPIYDSEVESLQTGTAVRAGVRQTWQTQRGGPGRWRSVDVLTLNVDYTYASGDTDRESPIPRFFDYRPEYSLLGGEFLTADVRWQVTDALGLVFNTVYDFEINQPARTIVGGTLEHTPEFRTFLEARYVNALDITYLDIGAEARLTRRYTAAGYATYDTDAGDFRSYGGVLRRRFPALTLGVSFAYDNLTDDFSVGFVIEPLGLAQQPVRLDTMRR